MVTSTRTNPISQHCSTQVRGKGDGLPGVMGVAVICLAMAVEHHMSSVRLWIFLV